MQYFIKIFQDQSLEIIEPCDDNTNEKLMSITDDKQLNSLAIFHSCATYVNVANETESSPDVPKTSVRCGALLVTSEAIHVTTSFHWLCENIIDKVFSNQVTLTQPMSNLVELENVTRSSCTLNFMDELENKVEKWKFVFESYPRIAKTLYAIDEIWSKIFSVPLINDDQILS